MNKQSISTTSTVKADSRSLDTGCVDTGRRYMAPTVMPVFLDTANIMKISPGEPFGTEDEQALGSKRSGRNWDDNDFDE